MAQGPSLTGAQLPILGLFVSVPVRISVGEVCACTCVWMCLRVHVYMHMCICVWCLSELLITDITTNRSPQSYFPKLLYYEYINDQENTGGLSIKFYKPTSEPLQILESYHERGNLQTS